MNGYRQFLDKDNFNKDSNNLKITKVNHKKNGVTIHLFTNYICLYYKYVTYGKNNTAKVVTKVNKNYCAKYQYTCYENSAGENITLKEYKILNK